MIKLQHSLRHSESSERRKKISPLVKGDAMKLSVTLNQLESAIITLTKHYGYTPEDITDIANRLV